MMQRFKRILGLTLRILLTILLSFLFLEFLLLVFNDWVFRNSLHVYDPDMGYRGRPYAEWGNNITNEFGFNDHDYPHQRKAGTYRILIISDSFNWAGGLEGNYTSILERKFEVEFGDRRVEVINAGYGGTHTGEQLKALKKFGLQYNPDLVVLGFFVGNDFFDAHPWRKRIVVGGIMQKDIDIRKDWEIILFGQPFVLQSRLYAFLQEKWATYQYLQEQRQSQAEQLTQVSPSTSQPQPVKPFTYNEDNITETYLNIEMLRMRVSNQALATYAVNEYKTREDFTLGNVLAMRDLLAEKGIQFIVAAYPDEFQVDETLRQVVLAHYDLDPSQYQLDRPQILLWQFCTDHNIEYYDMLPTFQTAHQQGQRLYLINDSHWNDTGNALAAQYLFDVLVWKARAHLGL